ncbi:MAG: efflux RND transporter permease subunit [Candidatus Binataceae bacterium]|nr:efflux RND transporter permease subunit [Candidatus Binataceae bacterium]
MSLYETFIKNSVGTTLLTIALALAGLVAFRSLPVAPLPTVEFPTIQVQANLPGASPETMASSVATPLERQFGHIASLNEMTSTSYLGQTTIVLQFDLDRDIDAAGRDVQAAINAAGSNLPTNLPAKPTYRKVNPADPPILILALTSDIKRPGQLYDAADSILQQKLSQIEGVGQVVVGGGALPAVRVDINPTQLNKMGIGLEQIRSVLASANANLPKGEFADDENAWSVSATDQLLTAAEYQPLIVGYHNGSAVRLSDVASVRDSVQNVRASGYSDLKRAILILVWRQPGANVIDTVDRIYAGLPALRASIPASANLDVVLDRSTSIRESVNNVEGSLLISVCLVVLVVFLFLRDLTTTLIPGVVVPVSLVATFGMMYLFGFSIDNLSLMALTIATGFVVDDAIVVVENISRYLDRGYSPYRAAVAGTKEIGFTVISISMSLIAVFIPILLMGGIVGRLFREFAITLASAVLVSMVVSLTTTPMMCAKLMRRQRDCHHGRLYNASERGFDWMLKRYETGLTWVLRHSRVVLGIALLTVAVNLYLFYIIPKGFFPEQDNGRLVGAIVADQDTSYQAMNTRLLRLISTVRKDPAVYNVLAFTGTNGATNTATMFVGLKPLGERKLSAEAVIARIRKKLAKNSGLSLYLQAQQDLRIGGRSSNAEFQYTLTSDDLHLLTLWAPKLLTRLRAIPRLTDVSSDQQNSGLSADVSIDRDTASRLGLSAQVIDDSLYDAFGQRDVSTMYTPLNQYFVVMEVAPEFWQSPETLDRIYLASNTPPAPPAATTNASAAGPSASAAINNATTSFTASTFVDMGGLVRGIQSAVGTSVNGLPSATVVNGTPALATGLEPSVAPATSSTTSSLSPLSSGILTTNSGGTAGTPSIAPLVNPGSGTSTSSIGNALTAPAIIEGAASAPGAGVSVIGTAASAEISGGAGMIPLDAFSRLGGSTTPLAVNHQGQFPAVTVSFNLAPGTSLGQAVDMINRTERDIHMPADIRGTFAGTAQAFQASLSDEPMLIFAALLSVYIVLGILYESYVHPITILSTLPSAGVGALLALEICGIDLSVIALVGIILLIGIVKKNAILMIDFALEAERVRGESPEDAIFQACLLRFRPITMTTMAALLGGLPLALGTGYGSELRRPLGVAIVGGLIVSQMLTLFTTPVIYLYLDRVRLWGLRFFRRGPKPSPAVLQT